MNTSNNRDINGLVRVHYNHCDSTQTRTAVLLSKIKPNEGLVISSDYQSEGRGQHGSTWSASKGLNLLMSIYFKPDQLKISNQFLLNIWSSIAIAQVLENYFADSEIRVKWPNDVLVRGKKIAGVIVQCSVQGNKIQSAVLGIGMNVNEKMQSYPFASTSVKEEANKNISLGEIREELIGQVQEFYFKGMQQPDILFHKNAYEQRLWKLNHEVRYKEYGQNHTGIIKGINDRGELLLSTEEQVRKLSRGEVAFFLE